MSVSGRVLDLVQEFYSKYGFEVNTLYVGVRELDEILKEAKVGISDLENVGKRCEKGKVGMFLGLDIYMINNEHCLRVGYTID